MPDAAHAVDGEDDFVIFEDVGETTVYGNPRDRLGIGNRSVDMERGAKVSK